MKGDIRQLKQAASKRRVGAQKKEKQKIGAYDKGWVGRRSAKQMKRALNIERRLKERIEEKSGLFKRYEKDRKLQFAVSEDGPEVLLNVNNLRVAFQERTVIQNLSLTVRKGQRIAVIGPNGCGKTTLFNVIDGRIPASAGSVRIPGQVRINRAFQKPLWDRGMLRDRLRNRHFDETRFRQIMGVFDVEGAIFERPLETFSMGQIKKVDLTRSFMSEAHLLLWDEPVNYIDILSREQIEEAVLICLPTMLFIEHDRYFIERTATDVIELPA